VAGLGRFWQVRQNGTWVRFADFLLGAERRTAKDAENAKNTNGRQFGGFVL
jgi:hypothetical protein